MVTTQRCHTLARPTIATTSEQTIAIEHTGYRIIGTDSCQHSDAPDNFLWRLAVVLTATATRQPQLRVHTGLPVNDKDYFAGVRIDIDNNLANERSNDTLFYTHIGCRSIPYCFQICGKLLEFFRRRVRHCILAMRMLLDLQLQHLLPF